MDRGVSTLISILAAGSLTVAGCSAAGGQAQNGQSEQPLQTGIGQSGAKDGRDAPVAGRDGLPPGVLPPREPAQPGDARLGPDGHYDYAASDFVLTNPCDDPEIMAKLEKLGQREDPGKQFRINGAWHVECVLGEDGTGPIGVWYQEANFKRFETLDFSPKHRHEDGFSWVITRQKSNFSDGCVASVETQNGSLSIAFPYPLSQSKSFDSVQCSPASNLLLKFLKEK